MTIATVFIAELERAIAQDRLRAQMLVQERFRGLPTNTVAAMARVTNTDPALTPNADGEFLLAA